MAPSRCTAWRLAIIGIIFVLGVNFSSIAPYISTSGAGSGAQEPAPIAGAPAAASGGGAMAASAAAVAPVAAAAPHCPGRKPFHTILTATVQVYQQWQCRIMYRHWLKQRALDPRGACTEMTGFTRLVASQDGLPDGVEGEVPSVFVREISNAELNQFKGYRVINRPYSVVQLMRLPYWRESIREEYVLIAETDHIFMQPVPNSAALGAPSAYIFNYMGANKAYEGIVHRHWRAGCGEACTAPDFKIVQPIGPSPVIIAKADLERVGPVWHKTAVSLKGDREAESHLGWVIEMCGEPPARRARAPSAAADHCIPARTPGRRRWGYAIASASIGLRHTLFADFQVEPGALSSRQQLERFTERYWILHYTYQFE